MNSMFFVIVKFEIKRDFFASFLKLVKQNAQTSLTAEPGCKQFDVAVNKQQDIILVEGYLSERDFDLHLKSEHFRTFSEETAEMVLHKTLETASVD